MFQALKRLFRKEERPAAPPPSASPTPQAQAPAKKPRATAPAPATPRQPPAAKAPPAPARPAAPQPLAPVPQPSAPSDATQGLMVRLPLKAILNRLPAALKTHIRKAGTGNVQATFPMESLVHQLAQGRVQISFGQLRAAVPAGVISDSPEQDATLIELPLPEILAQIPPHLLPRRQAQKMIHVPDEVAPVFGKQGADIKVLSKQSPKATPTPPAPSPAATPRLPAEPKLPAAPVKSPYRDTPKPTPPAPKPPPLAPTPPGAPIQMTPSDVELLAKAKAAADKAPSAPARTPAPTSAAPKAPVSTPAPTPPPAPARVAAPVAKGSIVIPVEKVFDALPDAIKGSLAQAKAQNAVFALPAAEIEQGLKAGKVKFSWKMLRSTLQPAAVSSTTPSADQLTVELPLPVVAPLFLASHRPAPQQKKIDIDQEIPDVFENRRAAAEAGIATAPAPRTPPPTAAPAPAPAAPAPQPKAAPPTPAPAPAPAPKPGPPPPAKPVSAPEPAKPAAPSAPAPIPVPAARPPEPAREPAAHEIGELFGQPGRKNWTPAEIAQKTTLLDGVGGALIVLQDGLLVAAKLPPGLDGDTIAAFLPQMYGRMSQYCKELNLGDPKKMTFVIDEMPLKIYRGAGVYFAVLGQPGEDLPQSKLDVIAAQLGSQSKA